MLPRFVVLLASVLLVANSAPLTAQPRPEDGSEAGPPRVFAGGGVWFADPRGEFGRYVEGGWGLEAHGRYALDGRGIVSLRGELGFIQYGRETRRVCFGPPVGCRIVVDLTTSNDIFVGGLGPELGWPGDRIRPYLHGTVGFSHFATTSSLEGTDDREDFARTNNFSDGTLSWKAGMGIQFRVSDYPIWIDVGAVRHWNGRVSYLREGDIIDQPDGSIVLRPRRSDADLATFRIGVSVGIRSDRVDGPRISRRSISR